MREVGWVIFDEIHYMRDPGTLDSVLKMYCVCSTYCTCSGEVIHTDYTMHAR